MGARRPLAGAVAARAIRRVGAAMTVEMDRRDPGGDNRAGGGGRGVPDLVEKL
jgi:hypothetical protein